jgi:hypothetical protein
VLGFGALVGDSDQNSTVSVAALSSVSEGFHTGRPLDPDDLMKMPHESVLDDVRALWKVGGHRERLPRRKRLEERTPEVQHMRVKKRDLADRSRSLVRKDRD